MDKSVIVIKRMDFNPRSPWGERLAGYARNKKSLDFNPRSPWGERRGGVADFIVHGRFQSTLPVGGATIGITLVHFVLK